MLLLLAKIVLEDQPAEGSLLKTEGVSRQARLLQRYEEAMRCHLLLTRMHWAKLCRPSLKQISSSSSAMSNMVAAKEWAMARGTRFRENSPSAALCDSATIAQFPSFFLSHSAHPYLCTLVYYSASLSVHSPTTSWNWHSKGNPTPEEVRTWNLNTIQSITPLHESE
jgi:hypothetical protein